MNSDDFMDVLRTCCSREQYDALYRESVEDPQNFWAKVAREFHWEEPWKSNVLAFNFNVDNGKVDVSWFAGGKTNMAWNCIERNIQNGCGEQTAFIWEGNNLGEEGKKTYLELQADVNRLANWLKSAGVKKNDAVIIYLPMIMELPVAMLACARIGAVHSVVFAGFSSEALAQRLLGCKAKVVLTCSAVMRGSKHINLKGVVDEACDFAAAKDHAVDHCLCFINARLNSDNHLTQSRDKHWQNEVDQLPRDCETEWMDAEDPLFMLYTSGSTGSPKGVLHTTGGYMIYAGATCASVFNMRQGDVFWCTADCGWITGHTYLTYGPLLNGATSIVFEGVPNYPDAGRCWNIIDKYKVKTFYTAPTALRALQRYGDDFVKAYKRSSLKILGTVGEPINPEAWQWYFNVVGEGRCPVMDTWWQTETGGHMITPLPLAIEQKPGSATLPFFGVEPVLLNENGVELLDEAEGYLCFKTPWPSMFRTLFADHQRYEESYFSMFKGYYFSGDGAKRDADGYYWITGRVDDVMNVSGHRIGTAEVESALVTHAECVEAAVVGIDHPIKGQSIYAFVTLRESCELTNSTRKALVDCVRAMIGPFAAPDTIQRAPALPKTRSGKIMRRILRKIASREEESLGDTSTLADPTVVDTLVELRDK
ncbi:AMP-dependent synthetase/ligase [Ostreococcus tauri]|uniref:Acetyl-coenzyme A synthetase n=1 Tax=Ostreococcus tauri TaxID=70448 RepID=A0A090M7M2_OSTTA|nr:AMP-dependent synthetase/ligase [Ostreococcus tauri]CEG01033.1 AMP-dependent synthetase/ligase [Ostreococcus tauri]|eukprot:XP_003075046.2 AMP-dependent synthetase/ligase [Ostreococcus tauri]